MKNKDILEKALNLFEEKELEGKKDMCITGNFQSLLSTLIVSCTEKGFSKEMRTAQYTLDDLENIITIVDKICWMQNVFISSKDSSRWMCYTKTDIEHIYIEMRSIFDYVAILIVFYFPNLKFKNSKKSFNALLSWIIKNKDKIDKDLLKLFNKYQMLEIERKKTSFFDHIKMTRDDIGHNGAFAIVFSEPENGVLVNIHKICNEFKSYKNLLCAVDSFGFNNNIVYFEKWFAVQFSYLLVFCEEIAELIIEKFNIEKRECHQPRCNKIYKWINDFHEELKDNKNQNL